MNRLDASAEIDPAQDEDEDLIRVLDGYLADLEAGRALEPSLLLVQHPALAERLRACLAGLQLIDEAGPPRGGAAHLGTEFDGYTIVREAGRGGMGIVYEAIEAAT